ncbi:SRPBCC domain-containing protein [Mucilaginibacter sp. L3T2-6]|uniref:SRPBCC family protein n=1 Tax=Mucilaginibacter sp. L3T2-6 TaxID=3062491 RepID=UPI0026774B6E|nr:SRPBCC domain-containing protein [Mucilaginibacter sp. L3T2-6]MDO3643203.1 SRPBCC domain-containing protein [Mucilaginibacter sp. L3T2-6]MDV6215527.1 SRPBCC domain-containing protein [Mucilaginibacter sp. L3T2-6]
MELKTKIKAEDGRQDLLITREFDLPVELLFKAYAEPEFVEQWMGTKVLKLESKSHGSYRFETSDAKGNVVFKANGVIHEFSPGKKIIRTFEMENAPFGIQLEIYEFEALTDDTSKLTMHVIYESADKRDQLMQLPFKQGLNMAHNRLQDVMGKLK